MILHPQGARRVTESRPAWGLSIGGNNGTRRRIQTAMVEAKGNVQHPRVS